MSKSFLGSIDPNDIAAMRRIMAGLKYYMLHTVLNPNADALKAMGPTENAAVNEILVALRNGVPRYTLLLRACLRFVYAYSQSDMHVHAAAMELAELGDSIHFTAPGAYIEEYNRMEAVFNQQVGIDIYRSQEHLPELAPGIFGGHIYSTARANVIDKILSAQEVRDLPNQLQQGDWRAIHEKFRSSTIPKIPRRHPGSMLPEHSDKAFAKDENTEGTKLKTGAKHNKIEHEGADNWVGKGGDSKALKRKRQGQSSKSAPTKISTQPTQPNYSPFKSEEVTPQPGSPPLGPDKVAAQPSSALYSPTKVAPQPKSSPYIENTYCSSCKTYKDKSQFTRNPKTGELPRTCTRCQDSRSEKRNGEDNA